MSTYEETEKLSFSTSDLIPAAFAIEIDGKEYAFGDVDSRTYGEFRAFVGSHDVQRLDENGFAKMTRLMDALVMSACADKDGLRAVVDGVREKSEVGYRKLMDALSAQVVQNLS